MSGEPKGPGMEQFARCPVCGKDSRHEHRPFCSRRCRDIDLARWLGGRYAIAGGRTEADEDGDDSAAAAAQGKAPNGAADSEE